jgi:hypothetical protein
LREALPMLLAEVGKNENRPIRADLVEIIWQYRDPQVLGFLAESLLDPDPKVWEQALDGLVAIGGNMARSYIQSALEQLGANVPPNGLTVEWLREALNQIA